MVTQGIPVMDRVSGAAGRREAGSLAGCGKVASSVHAGICSRMATMGQGGRPPPGSEERDEMKLIIEDDEGRKTVVPLVRDEITIGRQEGNTIRLTERNVSRRHARLVKENGHVLIEDLGSYNGVRVNGEKITAPTRIKEGDLVEIGDYDLGIQGKLEASTATPASGTVRPPTIPPGGMKTLPPVRPSTVPPQSTPIPGALAVATASASAEKAPAGEKPPPTPSATPNASAGGATAIIRVSDVLKAMPQGEA